MKFMATDLKDLAIHCLAANGMSQERATVVAEVLVEADLMGHDTHGLAQLPAYLAEIEAGNMNIDGEIDILSDNGTVQVWDGCYLPGAWLVTQAIQSACERAGECGVAIVSIRRSHHIGCLQSYLPAVTARGQTAFLCCSDPRSASVAPHNGMTALFTPNPIAFGYPTEGDPVWMDISTSITTNGMVARLAKEGRKLPGIWARDAKGEPTDDARAVHGDAGGVLLPIGGLDHGHKGYALSLMVETLSQALSGHGRADERERWGGSVFVQVMDGRHFAGTAAFTRQTTHMADSVRATPPAPGCAPVRLPGQAALERRKAGLAHGVALRESIASDLQMLAGRFGLAPLRPAD